MAETVRVEGLSGTWGDFAFRELTLELAGGEYFVLLGPIGSGKTLLLECIAGVRRPAAGSIFIGNDEVTNRPSERRGIGFVYQHSMLFPHLTVAENVRFGLRFGGLSGSEMKERETNVVDLLGIGNLLHRSPENLSGGERQKVALARALAVQPKVLLLDEPLTPLDNLSREILREQLKLVHRELGTTTIEVTHDQQSARMQADRVGVIQDGEILQVGGVEEVFEKPQSAFVAEFLGTENIFMGRVEERSGDSVFALNAGQTLRVSTAVRGEAGICIRPELVQVMAESSPPRENTFSMKIREISDLGPVIRITAAGSEFELRAVITKPDFKKLSKNAGDTVCFELPLDALHVFSTASQDRS